MVICPKHRHPLVFCRKTVSGYRLRRCPDCVAEAKAKVRLEFARWRKWHPCGHEVRDANL